MNEKKTADYAFPSVLNVHGIGRIEQTGMTLRDWFAGQILQGLLAAGHTLPWAAEQAFKNADVALAAREVKP